MAAAEGNVKEQIHRDWVSVFENPSSSRWQLLLEEFYLPWKEKTKTTEVFELGGPNTPLAGSTGENEMNLIQNGRTHKTSIK